MAILNDLKGAVRDKIFERGEKYYQRDQINEYNCKRKDNQFKIDALIQGSRLYSTDMEIIIGEEDSTINFGGRCSCPYDWGPVCKHQVAVMYKFLVEDYPEYTGRSMEDEYLDKLVDMKDRLEKSKQVRLDYKIKGLLTDSLVNFKMTLDSEHLELEQLDTIIDYIHGKYYRGGLGELEYILKNKDRNKINYLAKAETKGSQSDASLLFPKSMSNLNFILDLVEDSNVYFIENDEKVQQGEDFYLAMKVEKEDDKININPELNLNKKVYSGQNVKWIVEDGKVRPIKTQMYNHIPAYISVTGNNRGRLLFDIIPELENNMKVKVDQDLKEHELVTVDPEIELEFDHYAQKIVLQVELDIADETYEAEDIFDLDLTNKHYHQDEDNPKLWRGWETEGIERLQNILKEYNFNIEGNRFVIEDQNDIQRFLIDGFPHLPEEWAVKTTPEFEDLEVVEVDLDPEINFSEDSEINWFEFEVTYNIDGESYSREELQELLNYDEKGSAYFKNEDKYFLVQNTQQEEEISKILDQADSQESGGYKSRKYNLLYYQELIEEKGIKFEGNQVYNELEEDITEENLIKEVEIPDEVTDKLRGYQKEGYYWLRFLHKYNFGGVLADDMGLGKTLQTLTLLKSVSLEKPAFVVCPRSLIYNWGLEIDKFFSDLEYLVYHGTPDEREEMRETLTEHQILITSYSIIRQDGDELQDLEFSYCILDEAHHIKNRETQKARAVKQMPAVHKLALTGTPLENSLKELWSIFDFLMPGYLNNYNQFKKNYLKPINDEQDQQKLNELKSRIAPFILRRTKEEVASDLPDKLINIHKVEMTQEQEESYQAVLEQVTSELEETVQDKGFNKSQINVLAALTKLRQICDHPDLILDSKKKNLESAKVNALLEIVEDAIEAEHKLVVFSQFVKMLKIIRKRFKKQGIEFCYLDGSTRNRIEEVKTFNQSNDKKVFLISLKAGGLGLNLTAADMVVHVDPWWNPMVERQASDRVHRIGQDSKVTIYKLISAGTVEEKMLKLKERKRNIFESVIENNDSPLQNVSWKDIQELLSYK